MHSGSGRDRNRRLCRSFSRLQDRYLRCQVRKSDGAALCFSRARCCRSDSGMIFHRNRPSPQSRRGSGRDGKYRQTHGWSRGPRIFRALPPTCRRCSSRRGLQTGWMPSWILPGTPDSYSRGSRHCSSSESGWHRRRQDTFPEYRAHRFSSDSLRSVEWSCLLCIQQSHHQFLIPVLPSHWYYEDLLCLRLFLLILLVQRLLPDW